MGALFFFNNRRLPTGRRGPHGGRPRAIHNCNWRLPANRYRGSSRRLRARVGWTALYKFPSRVGCSALVRTASAVFKQCSAPPAAPPAAPHW